MFSYLLLLKNSFRSRSGGILATVIMEIENMRSRLDIRHYGAELPPLSSDGRTRMMRPMDFIRD
jgi:hypothetical protein